MKLVEKIFGGGGKELCVKIVWLYPETILLKNRENRQIRDNDSNGVHIDTAFVDDIEGCNGKDNNITDLDSNPDMKMSIIP